MMKRKLTALLLALAMLLTFAACGGDNIVDNNGNQTGAVDKAPDNDAGNDTDNQTNDNTGGSNDVDTGSNASGENPAEGDGSWAVYWYLCGSDLETNYGCATTDLVEMLEVALPENVNVVIQTGGAAVWQNDLMDVR